MKIAEVAEAAGLQLPDEEVAAELNAQFEEFHIPAQGEVLPAETMAHLDRMLAKVRALDAEVAKLRQVADMRIADVEHWYTTQAGTLQRQAGYLRMVLEHAAKVIDYGKKKSVNLPSGVLGRRLGNPTLEIADEAAALAFSKANKLPTKEYKEEPQVSALKEWWRATSEVPAGCKVKPPEEREYVKTADE